LSWLANDHAARFAERTNLSEMERAFTTRLFSSADRHYHVSLTLAAFVGKFERGVDESSDTRFHVCRATTIELAIFDLRAKGIDCPIFGTEWDHVDMSTKAYCRLVTLPPEPRY